MFTRAIAASSPEKPRTVGVRMVALYHSISNSFLAICAALKGHVRMNCMVAYREIRMVSVM